MFAKETNLILKLYFSSVYASVNVPICFFTLESLLELLNQGLQFPLCRILQFMAKNLVIYFSDYFALWLKKLWRLVIWLNKNLAFSHMAK